MVLEATPYLGLPVPLAGVIVPLARLEPSLDVHEFP
jgi:hypothetical protein